MDIKKDPTVIAILGLTIMFSIIFGMMAYFRNEKIKILRPEVIKARKEMNETAKTKANYNVKWKALSQLVGWNYKRQEYRSSLMYIKQQLNDWNSILKNDFKLNTYPEWVTVTREEPSFENGKKVTKSMTFIEQKGIAATELITELEKLIKQKKEEDLAIQGKIDTLISEEEGYFGPRGKIQSKIESIDAEIQSVKKRYQKKQRDVKDRLSTGEERVQDLFREIELIMENRNSQLMDVKQQIIELTEEYKEYNARLKYLTTKEAEMPEGYEIDGKVLSSYPTNGYVYINIGKKDCLFLGTEFKVYRLLKGGVRKDIGLIRVNELDEDFSQAILVALDDDNTSIEENDYIESDDFNADDEKSFLILGQMKTMSNDEAKRRLKARGWKVYEKPNLDLFYVVYGIDYEKDPLFSKIESYGPIILREADILQVIGD